MVFQGSLEVLGVQGVNFVVTVELAQLVQWVMVLDQVTREARNWG